MCLFQAAMVAVDKAFANLWPTRQPLKYTRYC